MKKLILIFVLCATAFSQSKPTKTGPTTVNGQLASGNAYFGDSASSGRPWVDVMNPSYGCHADGVTDDQPCIQAAITAAKGMNTNAGIDATSFGAGIYIPCGAYAIANPIVLPRSVSSGKLFGVVSIRGEKQNCVYLNGLASFPVTPTSIWLMNPGSGYGSNPTCAVSGGGGTGLTCAAVETSGLVVSVALSGTPSGFTSMPTITLSGGGGTGALAEAVGRGLIEWDQTQSKRTIAQSIEDITIKTPRVAGAIGIYYQYTPTNTPVTVANATNERLDRLHLKNLEIIGANQFNPAAIYTQGDCFACNLDTVSSNPSLLVSNYETVAVATDICAPTTLGDEACGYNFSQAHGLLGGGTNGGKSPAFQGRESRFDIDVAFCNGAFGGLPNSYCYGFINSYGGNMSGIANEGLGDQPQILLLNSVGMNFLGWGVGQPDNVGGGNGDGLDLVNSNRNTFVHRTSSFSASTAFQGFEWVGSVTVSAGGTLYGTPPTVVFTSNCSAGLPVGTATVSGGAVTAVTLSNTGTCTGTPSISFTGGGGSGATATANMTGLGTLFAAKLDSNSHNNTFLDATQTGTTDISVSDQLTNFVETCDSTNSQCATQFAIGTFPEYPTFCGTTSTCANTRKKGHFAFGSAPLASGSPSTVTITGITPAFTSSSTFVCTVTNGTTQANPLKVVNVSGSSITITGPNTVTDTANYICGGN